MELFIKTVIFVVLIYVVILSVVYTRQKNLIFFPSSTSFTNCEAMKNHGAELVEGPNDVRFYWLSQSQAQATLLVFHGNAGRACDRTYLVDKLKSLPINIAVAEYPGYAGSSATLNENNFLKNAVDTYNHLPNNNKVIVMGESLGTAVATFLASQKPVTALLLQSPFPSLTKVGQYHYPFLPVGWLLHHQFSADKWALDVASPVLALHPANDTIVPPALGRQQTENFSSSHKKFQLIPGKGHNNVVTSEQFWNSARDFIQTTALKNP